MVIFFGSSSSSCRDENLIQVKVFILVERLTDWFNDLHNAQYCSKVSYHTLARCESGHALWDSCKVHVNSLLMTSPRKISFRILKITYNPMPVSSVFKIKWCKICWFLFGRVIENVNAKTCCITDSHATRFTYHLKVYSKMAFLNHHWSKLVLWIFANCSYT